MTDLDMFLYCREHQNAIFIRRVHEGVWGLWTFAKIPFEEAAELMDKWRMEGNYPGRRF